MINLGPGAFRRKRIAENERALGIENRNDAGFHIAIKNISEIRSHYLGFAVYHAFVLGDLAALGNDALADETGGAEQLGLIHGRIQVFHAGIDILQLFQAGELGQLGNEFLILGRVQRVLVAQLGHQKLKKGTFIRCKPVSTGYTVGKFLFRRAENVGR